MEFEDLGAHCQHDGCNQRDFLPFKCDTCSKSLCLLHRSYVAHECHGSKMKDMTSIDCPICGKGVKFDRSQDANRVWDSHYLNDCTQQAPTHTKKEVIRCFKPGCNTVLGPSNKFTCSKCHMNVCLSHRIPEEHNCVGPIRKEFLERVQKNMKVGNADKPEKKKHEKQPGIFQQFDRKEKKSHNAHGEPAQAYAAPVRAHAHSAAPLVCPFCSLPHDSDAALVDHILAFHPEDGQPATAPSAAASSAAASPQTVFGFHPQSADVPAPAAAQDSHHHHGQGNAALHREVCPLCHMRFADAIALVRHFESAHSERSQHSRPADSTSGGSSSSAGGGSQCSLS